MSRNFQDEKKEKQSFKTEVNALPNLPNGILTRSYHAPPASRGVESMTAPVSKHDRMFATNLSLRAPNGDGFNAARGMVAGLCMGAVSWALIFWLILALA